MAQRFIQMGQINLFLGWQVGNDLIDNVRMVVHVAAIAGGVTDNNNSKNQSDGERGRIKTINIGDFRQQAENQSGMRRGHAAVFF